MAILEDVKRDYPTIHGAASAFLSKLTGTDIKKDIALAAEMSGLALLRASTVDLKQIAPGTVVLGAVSDDAFDTLSRFLMGFAISNGLNAKNLKPVALPDDAKVYSKDLTRFEQPFHEVCKQHGIEAKYFPFVAAATAGKLVLAGNQMRLLDASVGLSMVMYHIIAGSKTVPYPVG
jgi:hypothetical protein